MKNTQRVSVDRSNVSEYGFYCVTSPKNEGYQLKFDWLKKRFTEGLKIRILETKSDGQIGFIEYIPAEFAWRPIIAPGYMFVQCIMFNKKKQQDKGYGSILLKECIKEARKNKMKGVAAFASDGPWSAGNRIFLNNGFKIVDRKERFELLAHKFGKASDPRFCDWIKERKKYKGWNLIYADQCPLLIKSVNDITETAKKMGINLKVIKLKTPKQAQKAPSGYGTYTIINNGKLISDHYISNTRFLNILKKEL